MNYLLKKIKQSVLGKYKQNFELQTIQSKQSQTSKKDFGF